MEAINNNLNLVASVVSLILLLMIYFAFKYKIDLWWLNFRYSFPWIGKLAILSRDNTRYAKNKAWTMSERKLCDDYKNFVHFSDETSFKRCLNYLSRAQDTGRSPLPGWMFFVLGVLLIAEGLGFSYLLGTWMAMEGSENTHMILMIAIVFVLAVVMLFITHSAGHQLYRTNLIRRCNKEWRAAGQGGAFASHPGLTLQKDLDHEPSLDADQPAYTQCVNRVGTDHSLFMLHVAIVAIIVIAVTSTWMRVQHLEAMQTQETAGLVSDANAASASNPIDPFASLPAELGAAQTAADSKAKADVQSATKGEGIMAFAMLGFIFIITQIVGIAAGYKWGFAGKESKDAYSAGTHGFASYDHLLQFYQPVIQIAQAKLQTLQALISERDANTGEKLEKSFTDYLIEKSDEIDDYKKRLQARQTDTNRGQPAVLPVAAPSPNAGQVVQAASLDEHIANLGAMGDEKEAKKAYIGKLDSAMKEQVMAYLKREKEAREAAKQREDKELEDLL